MTLPDLFFPEVAVALTQKRSLKLGVEGDVCRIRPTRRGNKVVPPLPRSLEHVGGWQRPRAGNDLLLLCPADRTDPTIAPPISEPVRG